MKKLIAMLLAVVMLVSMLAACGNKTNTETPDAPATPDVPTTPEVPAEQPSDPVLTGTLEAIIDAIYAITTPPIPVGTMAIDLNDEFMLSAFTGLTDKTPVKEAAFSEGMMGAQAYSVVLVRLNNEADAQTVAQGIADGVDTRKWICAEADSLRVVAYKDLVLLVMIDSMLNMNVNDYINAFGTLCGNPFTVDIDRTVGGAGGSAFNPANVDLNGDLAMVIEAIYATETNPLPLMSMPVLLEDAFTLETYLGLKDASKVKEAVVSEAMTGSQAYSLVMVRLNNAADAESVATEMLNGINPRKWICVGADDIRVVACDDLLLFVMLDSGLGLKADSYINAFGTICGKNFTVDMKK